MFTKLGRTIGWKNVEPSSASGTLNIQRMPITCGAICLEIIDKTIIIEKTFRTKASVHEELI